MSSFTSTAIILVGGQSRRMQAVKKDKSLLEFKGKTFLEHIADAVKPLVTEIILVGMRGKGYQQFLYKRVSDVLPQAGPLAGIYSGLRASKTEYNFVLSCDVPLITTELLRKLPEKIEQVNNKLNICDGVLFQSKDKQTLRKMPLVALYRQSCVEISKKLLDQGERRMMTLVESPDLNMRTILLEGTDREAVKNINTPEDLATLRNKDKQLKQ